MQEHQPEPSPYDSPELGQDQLEVPELVLSPQKGNLAAIDDNILLGVGGNASPEFNFGLSPFEVGTPPPDVQEYEADVSVMRLLTDAKMVRPLVFIGGHVNATTENEKATSFISKFGEGKDGGVNNAPAGPDRHLSPISTVADRVFDVNFVGDIFEACDGLTDKSILEWMLSEIRLKNMRLRATTALYCLRASAFVDQNRDPHTPFGLLRPCYERVGSKSWRPRLCVESWAEAWQILMQGELLAEYRLSIAKKFVCLMKAIVTFNVDAAADSAFRTSLGLGAAPVPRDHVKECCCDDAGRKLCFQTTDETAIVITQAAVAFKLNRLRASMQAYSETRPDKQKVYAFRDEHLPLMNFVNNFNHVSVRNEMAFMHIYNEENKQAPSAAAAVVNVVDHLRQMSPAYAAWSRRLQAIRGGLSNIVGEAADMILDCNAYFSLLAFVLCTPVPPRIIPDNGRTFMTVSFDLWVNQAHRDIVGPLAYLSRDTRRDAQKEVFVFGLPSREPNRDVVDDVKTLAHVLSGAGRKRTTFPILYPTCTGPATTTIMRRVNTSEHMGVLTVTNVVNTDSLNSDMQDLHMDSSRQTPERLLLIRANTADVVVDRLILPITLNSVVLPTNAKEPNDLKRAIMRRLFMNYTARPIKPPKRGLGTKKKNAAAAPSAAPADDIEEDEEEEETDNNSSEDYRKFSARSNFVCVVRAKVPRQHRIASQVAANLHMHCWERYLKLSLSNAVRDLDARFMQQMALLLYNHIDKDAHASPRKFVQYAIDVLQSNFKVIGNDDRQTSTFAGRWSELCGRRQHIEKRDVDTMRGVMIEELEQESEVHRNGKRYWHTEMWCAMWLSLCITELVVRRRTKILDELSLNHSVKMELIHAWRDLISWFVSDPIDIDGTDQCFFRGSVHDLPEQFSQRYTQFMSGRIEDIVAHYLSARTAHQKPNKPIQLLGTAVLPIHTLKLAFLQQVPNEGAWRVQLRSIKLLCALHDMQTHHRLFSRASLPLASLEELQDSERLAKSIDDNMKKSHAFQKYLSQIVDELPHSDDKKLISQYSAWWKLFTCLPNYRATAYQYFQEKINNRGAVPAVAAAAAAPAPASATEQLKQEIAEALTNVDRGVYVPLLFRPTDKKNDVDDKCRSAQLLLSGAVRALPLATLVDLNKMVNRISAQLREEQEFTDMVTELQIAAKITAAVEYCFCTKGSAMEILLNRGSWLGGHDTGDNSVSEAVDALVRQLAMQFAIRMMVANQAQGGAAPNFVLLFCSDLALHFLYLATEIAPRLLAAADVEELARIKAAFLSWTGIGADHYDPQQPIAPQLKSLELMKKVEFDGAVKHVVAIIYESASTVMNQLRLWGVKSKIPAETMTRLVEALRIGARTANEEKMDMSKAPIHASSTFFNDASCKAVVTLNKQLSTQVMTASLGVRNMMRLCFDEYHAAEVQKFADEFLPPFGIRAIDVLKRSHVKFVVTACLELLHKRQIGAGYASAAWMQQLRESLVVLTELAEVNWKAVPYSKLKNRQIESIIRLTDDDLTLPFAMCAHWDNDCHIVELATTLFAPPKADATAAADDDDDDDNDKDDDEEEEEEEKKKNKDGDDKDDEDAFFSDQPRSFASGNYMFTALGNILNGNAKFREQVIGPKVGKDEKERSLDAVEDDNDNGTSTRPDPLKYAPLTADDPNAEVVTFINTLTPTRQFTVWFEGMDFPNWLQAVRGNQFASVKLWNRYLNGGPIGSKFLATSTVLQEFDGVNALLEAQAAKFKGSAPRHLEYIMKVDDRWATTAQTLYDRLLAANASTQGKAVFIFVRRVPHGAKTLWLPIVVRVPTPIGGRLFPDAKQSISIDYVMPKTGTVDRHAALREAIYASNSKLISDIRQHALEVYHLNYPSALHEISENPVEINSLTTSTTCAKAYGNGMKVAYGFPVELFKRKWIAKDAAAAVQIPFKSGTSGAKPAAAAVEEKKAPTTETKLQAPTNIGLKTLKPWTNMQLGAVIPNAPFIFKYGADIDMVRN